MQRSYTETLLDFIRGHPHFHRMRVGIAAGEILLCLRKDKIDFYEGGARLFRFGVQTVFTHRQYIDHQGNGERALSKEEQTQQVFETIRNTARTYRADNVTDELAAVHALFPALAITRNKHQTGRLALIDVEARFRADEAEGLPNGMIDLVFLMPDHRVLFVEAKCMGNASISSIGIAAVHQQVQNYEKYIVRPTVLEAIKCSIQAQASLLHIEVESVSAIFPRVPILLLYPSKAQPAIGPRNSWLADRLREADGWTVGSEQPRVIDGRRDPTAAIQAFVAKFGTLQAAGP